MFSSNNHYMKIYKKIVCLSELSEFIKTNFAIFKKNL